MSAIRTISADGLTLEPQIAAHAEEMYGILSDPGLYEFEGEPPSSPAWLHDRFTRLESRRSEDGTEQWLNWVIRLATGELAGYVQATVLADGQSHVAYVLGSRFWGRGIAQISVRAMLQELTTHHGSRELIAMLKSDNWRSRKLLDRLGFVPFPACWCDAMPVKADEIVMILPASQ